MANWEEVALSAKVIYNAAKMKAETKMNWRFLWDDFYLKQNINQGGLIHK